jgi:hypothetical protein
MSSYVYSFTTASDNITTSSWNEIVLDDSDGGYVHANTGHQAIDISVISDTNVGHTLTLAWVDCDSNKANSVIGVSKIDVVTATTTGRTVNINGTTTTQGYVLNVSAASSSSSTVRTIGIGPCIDLRSSPVSLPKRRLFVGLTTRGAGANLVTVIVTPTKII